VNFCENFFIGQKNLSQTNFLIRHRESNPHIIMCILTKAQQGELLMNVFIAGASGAIGRPLVNRLLAEGHTITALTRSETNAQELRRKGANTVVADVFDREKLTQAMLSARPAVVINQLTSIPSQIDVRHVLREFAQTNRLRIEGTQILMEAAQKAGAKQFIAQSFAAYYTPHKTGLATEDQALYLDAPSAFAEIVQAIGSLENTVLSASNIVGTVLRYGHFYGPGTAYASDGSLAEVIRQRQMPIIGKGSAVFSFIHVEDAAEATVLAMRQQAAGIYNIVDDDPASLPEWVAVYANLLNAPHPFHIPNWIGHLAAGRFAVHFMNEQRGVSNLKAKQVLGWQPRYASWREGFPMELGQSVPAMG
jgi:nucleoside-diphosphate-sugar epimerase